LVRATHSNLCKSCVYQNLSTYEKHCNGLEQSGNYDLLMIKDRGLNRLPKSNLYLNKIKYILLQTKKVNQIKTYWILNVP